MAPRGINETPNGLGIASLYITVNIPFYYYLPFYCSVDIILYLLCVGSMLYVLSLPVEANSHRIHTKKIFDTHIRDSQKQERLRFFHG